MTAICVPIFLNDKTDFLAEIRSAEVAQADILEFRADTATLDQLHSAFAASTLPALVTIRPTWEGGHSEFTDEQRAALFEAAIAKRAAYIDVELVTWEESDLIRERIRAALANTQTKLILSNHSFEGRPTDFEDRTIRLRRVEDAHILKLAWKADSVIDGLDALRLARDLHRVDGRPIIALAMGEAGLISRILAKKFGAFLTFATSAAGKESAPGQPTIHDLRTIYRWDKQHARTPVFGVIGCPVGHSLSPHIHNAGFDAIHFDGVYVPLLIQPAYKDFARVVDGLRAASALHLHGLSVTIPHKENALRYALENHAAIDDLTRRIGVANTLVWDKRKSLTATNSDYSGALDALVSAWSGNRSDVAGKRIAVLGAGGAARAIVASLAAHGATVLIYNRTPEKAAALAAEFSAHLAGPGTITAAAWGALRDSAADAYINCTPLGMYPKIDASPIDFPPTTWTPNTVVFDTVYNPLHTQLLKAAQSLGAKTIPGAEMFVRQAAIQFQLFTGKDAPLEVFRKILWDKLQAPAL